VTENVGTNVDSHSLRQPTGMGAEAEFVMPTTG
jgi:hypothetical protein